jgi:probable F420-dependent oxidoreductase
MKVGLVLPQLGTEATKENIEKIAVGAENGGFDSLWVAERLLWPVSPQTPYPATADGSLPTFYQRVFDPLETLTFVAGKTERIALGTSVIDMLFHNPVVLAKRFATLDLLSDGRAICGLGIGWSKDEYQASNIPFKDRGKRADEFAQALRKMWQDDIVEFHGQFYSIPSSKIGPKPVQKPSIPIYFGGYVPNAFARIAKYGDGWLATQAAGPIDFLEKSIASLNEQAAKINRNPKEFRNIVITFPQPVTNSSPSSSEGPDNNQSRFPLSGTIDQIGEDIKAIKALGFEQIVFAFTGLELDKIIGIAKEISSFAR